MHASEREKLHVAYHLFQGHVHDSQLNPGHRGLSAKIYIQGEHTIVAIADRAPAYTCSYKANS